jgi:ribose transport system permease protein
MNALRRLWHRHSPQLFLGELLEKRWMEPIVPFVLLVGVFVTFIVAIPSYASLVQLQQLMRSFPEPAFVAMVQSAKALDEKWSRYLSLQELILVVPRTPRRADKFSY